MVALASSASSIVVATTSITGFTGSAPVTGAVALDRDALGLEQPDAVRELRPLVRCSSRRPTITGVFTSRSAIACASG